MMDLDRLIGLADANNKLDIMAKEAPTSKLVVRVNVVDDGSRFYAILSGGLISGSNIIGVEITNGIDDFNEVVRPLGYEWNMLQSGMIPNYPPLGTLRCEQKYVSEGGYRRRLLLQKI